jgi:hypothetical protein
MNTHLKEDWQTEKVPNNQKNRERGMCDSY